MANVSSSNGLEKRPKLRFPGFDEPWTDVHLFDVVDLRRKRARSVKEVYVSTENLLQDFEGVTPYQSDDEVEGIAFNTGDTLLANIRPYLKKAWYAAFDGTCSADVLAFSPKRISPAFLYNIIARDCFIEYVMSGVKGSKMPRGDKTHILEYEFAIPEKDEQEKIATFIALADCKIAKQRKMIAALKKYKRGALKAVFTQQVSFSAKPQKWDKYKMGDLISLQSGQDFAPAEYNDQEIGVPYMTGASCIVKGETVVSRWTQIPRCYAYKGDTLLVCKGSGSGAVVRLTQEKAHIARQFMSLRANEKMTSDFCYYLTGFLSDRIKRNATGLIEGIDRGTVLNQTVFLPPLHEQKKIARFFSKLDFTITAHENMLDTLINERTGLMQRLFI